MIGDSFVQGQSVTDYGSKLNNSMARIIAAGAIDVGADEDQESGTTLKGGAGNLVPFFRPFATALLPSGQDSTGA